MAIRTEPMGVLVTGEAGTGATADSIECPWADQIVFTVKCAGGLVVFYIDRSLDGTLWTTDTGDFVTANSGIERIICQAPVGLIRGYLSINTGTTQVVWAAHTRSRA